MSNSTGQHLGVLSIRSEVEPIDPSDVPSFVSVKVFSVYSQVAIITVLVYDAFITLDKEAKYFWKVPQRAVDYVYFMNRYIGIFGAVAHLFCNFAQWTQDTASEYTLDYFQLYMADEQVDCNHFD
ncbi:hypothetical protein ACEPAF_9971 [Sanghuangporus sanghuang]